MRGQQGQAGYGGWLYHVMGAGVGAVLTAVLVFALIIGAIGFVVLLTFSAWRGKARPASPALFQRRYRRAW